MVDTVVCEWSWWTLVWVAHLIVDSGESGAVTADLVITVLPIYCGPRWTSTIMTQKSAVIQPFLPAFSNRYNPYDEQFSNLPNLPFSIQ